VSESLQIVRISFGFSNMNSLQTEAAGLEPAAQNCADRQNLAGGPRIGRTNLEIWRRRLANGAATPIQLGVVESVETMTPAPYLSRRSLAEALDIAESTVDEMVKRGVLPPPIKLSTGCVRWCWADVETALNSLKDNAATKGACVPSADPYIRGAQNVTKLTEGRCGTS
jgi:predicted DNA-binding transcriptional regulator AlpA